ncbi:MAG: Na+/H+ antiporter NhaA [Meiothermus sp.]|nr:Na+/H+ antiporter NhaA [Meiothermus sp.]
MFAPVVRLWNSDARGGIILFSVALAAFILANTEGYFWYKETKDTLISVGWGEASLEKTLGSWIKDLLMCFFFLLVGLEIKREIVSGQLSNPRRAVLTILAAIGGMVVPALIFTALNAGTPGIAGWGVPMATDIAFSIGVLSLLGSRVPLGLKVFLTAFAIVDDLGAVLVIAFFYTQGLNFQALFIALGFWLLALAVGFGQVRHLWVYMSIGAFMWFFMMQSGVSPTVAAVMLAFAVPMTRAKSLPDLHSELSGVAAKNPELLEQEMAHLEHSLHKAQSPLHRLEHMLQPWSIYVILPLFAFFNAGVNLAGAGGFGSVGLGAFLGLLLGKPIGIFLICFVAVRLGIAALPLGVNWYMILGAGFLGGIGFTMSLFVAALAYRTNEVLLNQATIGVLSASVVAAVVGLVVVSRAARRPPPQTDPNDQALLGPLHEGR